MIQSDLQLSPSWRSPTTFEFGSRELTIPKRSPAELPGIRILMNTGFFREVPQSFGGKQGWCLTDLKDYRLSFWWGDFSNLKGIVCHLKWIQILNLSQKWRVFSIYGFQPVQKELPEFEKYIFWDAKTRWQLLPGKLRNVPWKSMVGSDVFPIKITIIPQA